MVWLATVPFGLRSPGSNLPMPGELDMDIAKVDLETNPSPEAVHPKPRLGHANF